MKKFNFILFFILTVTAFTQQKYALVIGNGNYTYFGSLPNALNDATDMKTTLEDLGFAVDVVTDGNRAQMVEAITRFKNRLSVSKNSYGFFFYAGHGLQYNGINYLIPAKADIPNANYLGDTSISVQTMLAELNDAGNELNIVVLDACRDFPTAWSRSTNRGLTVVANQPADSIIVYATSAGSVASDGTGRNGLFTSHLLNQLRTPGLSVRDVFDRTGAAVSQASSRQQIPAIYSQYYGTAYLGVRFVTEVPAWEHIEKGKFFFEREDFDTAIFEFSDAIKIDSNLVDAYTWRAKTYFYNDDIEGALSDVNQAIKIDPNNALAYYIRGHILYCLEDVDRGIVDFNKAIMLDPDDLVKYIDRGELYLLINEIEKAITHFTQMIRLNPDDASAYGNRGDAYYNVKNNIRAIADYTQAIRLDPDNPDWYVLRALVYYDEWLSSKSNWYYNEIIADYSNAIKLDSNDADLYIFRGNIFYKKGDYEKAISDFTQAILLNPNSASFYSKRADVYFENKNYSRAIEDYTQTIQLGWDWASTYSSRGDAYYQRGDYDRAISDYTQAIQKGSNYAGIYNMRGNAYYSKGDYGRAIADYETALQLSPDEDVIWQNLVGAREARGW